MAQQYTISTVAGGAPPQTPVPGILAQVGTVSGIAANTSGNVYFSAVNCVFKLDTTGTVTRFAGTSRAGYGGDGGPATSATLNSPGGVAVDGSGNVYVVDTLNYRVRKISSTGTITTIAGTGTPGYTGDSSAAVNAQLNFKSPTLAAAAVDTNGNVFVTDAVDNVVRKISSTGVITTFAGGGPAYPNDNGLATNAQLSSPGGVAADGSGNLYIADIATNRIRKVTPNGMINTIAGGPFGDGLPGSGSNAVLNLIAGIAVDPTGDLFIANSFGDPTHQPTANQHVFELTVGGTFTSIAGTGSVGTSGDGGPATSATLQAMTGVAADGSGNVYVASTGIREIAANGIINTVVGGGDAFYGGDNGQATSALLNNPAGVALDSAGNLYIADTLNNRVRKVSTGGTITTIAGTGVAGVVNENGAALSTQLFPPTAIAADLYGNVYVADEGINFGSFSRIRMITTAGQISTIAGSANGDPMANGIEATSAQLTNPVSLAVDKSNSLYFADSATGLVRKIQNGVITTVAGTGAPGYSGDNVAATSAPLDAPQGIAFDSQGFLYIADTGNGRIRRVINGTIATIAGGGQNGVGYYGDGGPATSAGLNNPTSVAVDPSGNILIMDSTHRIRKVAPNGTITTVAGTGTAGYTGDGGAAGPAMLSGGPLASDSTGDIYFADIANNAIRELKPSNQPVLIAAVVDAASETVIPMSPGKIIAIYGAGMGPTTLVQNAPSNNVYPSQLSGTTVTINGTSAPLIYTSSTLVAAIVPYEVSGSTAQVVVTYQGQTSPAFPVSLAPTSPSFFTVNGTGSGQIAAVNLNGTINSAQNPVAIGSYISLYATGEGQTSPAAVDGMVAPLQLPLVPKPIAPVTVTIGGVTVTPYYAGAAPGEVEGLMQVVVQIPTGITPGANVPVSMTVGGVSTVFGSTWISVSSN